MNDSPGHCRTSECRWLIPVILFILIGISNAAAQSTRPAPSTSYENALIRKNSTDRSPTTRAEAGASVAGAQPMVDIRRLVLALGLVLALIFTLRWIGRKYFPNVAGGRAHGAVRVLSRSHVAAKQQVVLLQVGRRVLVVADNGTQMSPLSEITEPDEVAQLIGQMTSPYTADSQEFESEFGKAKESFDETTAASAAPMPDPQLAEVEPPADDSLESAQGEIKGLMQKVRGLAKQLGR